MKREKPEIAIGISDFRKIRQNKNLLYVDKSDFIADFIKNSAEVLLFTRPRRFGKTLNMSMLQYFFDAKDKETNKELFTGLKIYDNAELMAQQGTRPVIFLSFKDCKGNNWAEVKMMIDNLISATIMGFDHALKYDEMEPVQRDTLLRLKAKSAPFDESIKSLSLLCELLCNKTGEKNAPLLLIDEYDVPLQKAWIKGFWEEAASFMGSLFGASLKDNRFLWRGVLTGCMRISKESIFSDLNNLRIYSICSEYCSDHFGFTNAEVDDLLNLYELENKKELVQKWYDGYLFGKTTIYNPWSVLSYIADKGTKTESYWVNTSGNELVHTILFRADKKVKEQLSQLLSNETIEINHKENLVFKEIENSPDTIWSFLFSAGYLKNVNPPDEKGRLSLKVPNQELMTIFESSVKDWFSASRAVEIIDYIGQNLRNGDGNDFTENFRNMIDQSFSYFDIDSKLSENFYHAFTLGLIVHLSDFWRIKSNRESGYGRSDILMFPMKPHEYFGVVMEFKACRKAKDLLHEAEEALQQIEKKHYTTELKNFGALNILKIGIAFYHKQVEINWQKETTS
jgi:hypothetical protein